MEEKETITSNWYGWKFPALGRLFLQYLGKASSKQTLKIRKSHLHWLLVKDSYILLKKQISSSPFNCSFINIVNKYNCPELKYFVLKLVSSYIKYPQKFQNVKIHCHTKICYNREATQKLHSNHNFMQLWLSYFCQYISCNLDFS